ncbi:MAG: hypothetical protein Q8M84_03065 [Thiobacillus sp.]|nr:hypothetical protein [Thiobacillus sp.]
MNLADKAHGRIIHMSFDVTLIPPDTNNPGKTDAAVDIGQGLIREAMLLLKNAGEAEGFTVQIEARQVVY